MPWACSEFSVLAVTGHPGHVFTNIGGEKSGKRGRGAAGKELVVIAAQKDGLKFGRIRLQRVPDASEKSLKNVIQNNIDLYD